MSIATEADLPRLTGFSGEDQPDPDLLKACVHCGMCLSSCPTYRITGQEMSSPRGRLWMMSAVSEGRMDLLDPAFDEQMYQCLNCRACEAVCPSGVQYGPLVEASRAQLEQHRERSRLGQAGRDLALGGLFNHLGAMRGMVGGLRLYEKTGLRTVMQRSRLLDLVGMADLDRMLPPIAGAPLKPGRESWTAPAADRSVDLFNGCIMGTVFADTNRAAGRVMSRNGASVDVPVGQGCCGALQVHSGMMDEARAMARRNIDAFEAAGSDPIIVTAAGCGSTLKEYGHLLKDDPEYVERAARFAERVRDVTEYLAERPLETPPVRIERAVTYQEPCHLAHAQRITQQPRQLLAAIPGLEVIEMRESSLCCGSAGIYNITRKEMADQLGDRKAGNVIATGADEVITANPGCAMQLIASLDRNGSGMRVRHIVDLLDEAYGGPEGASAPKPAP